MVYFWIEILVYFWGEINTYALNSDSYNVPFFRAVTGHEIIHSIHYAELGTSIMESMSEAVAYRYSAMELLFDRCPKG